MEIINLTGHAITVRTKDGDCVIPPAETFRIRYSTRGLGTLNTKYGNIPITQNVYLRVKNPPPIQEGVIYIVSRLVAETYPERDDFYMTNGLIKEKGKPVACRSLGKI